MSRRAIALVAVFLGALLIANIIVVAIWLPNRKTVATKGEASNSTSVTSPATSASPPPNNKPSAAATVGPASENAVQPAGNFALERQVTSPSGHIHSKYFRDPNTKMRRIALEDVRRPGTDAVLCESKHTLWALVSPDDQWIAVNERNAADGGGIRLYHRESDSSVRYLLAEGSGRQGHTLQDTVWQSYTSATHADPNTPRRGVTVDATGWEGDSRKLNLSVAYLPAPDKPDVPEPWSCSYDLASKQVEPAPDQPAAALAVADGSAGDQDNATPGEGPEDESAAAASSAQNNQDANVDTAEDTELPGEKFPATRLDELTVPDVNESSLSEITYAINEMYARHGADFKDKKVAEQFSEFSWYKRRPGVSSADVEVEFSDLEKQNLKVLQRCRDAKVAAARRKSHPVRGERADEETTGQKILRGFRAWQDAGAPMAPHP